MKGIRKHLQEQIGRSSYSDLSPLITDDLESSALAVLSNRTPLKVIHLAFFVNTGLGFEIRNQTIPVC